MSLSDSDVHNDIIVRKLLDLFPTNCRYSYVDRKFKHTNEILKVFMLWSSELILLSPDGRCMWKLKVFTDVVKCMYEYITIKKECSLETKHPTVTACKLT